jgi:type II secretory pathway component PulJ
MKVKSIQSVPRSAFTLVEAAIVSALMAFLAMLISTCWSGLVRPSADLAAQCKLVHEANQAMMALSRDLGGSLSNPEGRLGTKTAYKVVGRMQPTSSQLWLCFDGGAVPNGIADWGSPDTIIVYEINAGNLIRWDQTSNVTITVAKHVSSLSLQELGDRVQITLTFSYRNITRTYTIVARDPS